jgi:hypothetical protein
MRLSTSGGNSRHSRRRRGVHARCFTEISTGVLPIQDIVDAASKLPKLEYMFLEQDHTTLPEIESIRRSHDAFASRFTGITWP